MILIDTQIRALVEQYKMLEPFSEGKQGDGIISFGLTSAGYDLRLGYTVDIFKNTFNTLVDPKTGRHNQEVQVDLHRRMFDRVTDLKYGDQVVLPPHSYMLAYSLEFIRMPRHLKGRCVGKCLAGGTRILIPETGEYKRLDEIKPTDRVAAIEFGKGAKEDKINGHFQSGLVENGRKLTYKVTLRSGVTIKATDNHPFMHVSGWKRLSELKSDDRIMVPGTLPFFGNSDMTWAEVKLLALMLADGQCGAPTPIYTKYDPRMVKMLKWAARKRLDCHVTSTREHHYRIVNRPGPSDGVSRNRMASWLESHGANVGSRDKMVPDEVFKLPKEKLAAFLRVLFSGDGTVYLANKSRKTPNVVVGYSSASRRMIEDIHHLLLRFGVRGVIKGKMVKGREYFNLNIHAQDDLARFFAHIGFVEGSFKDTFFKESASRYIKPVTKAPTTTYDEIVSIEENLIEPTFDIEVPGPHNFVANDIVVHNSTWARCGIIINTTPLEPAWFGHLTIEVANVSPCPVALYAGEGIAQLEFETLGGACEVDYAMKGGKYQGQGAEPIAAKVKE